MTKVFFSIIIPTFNAEKTISIALKSIISQSFGEFEILIIDGASSDNTLEVIKEYEDKPFITCVSEKDKGVYDAMNKGIQLAKGHWIYFLGSDDYLFNSNVLEHVHDTITHTSTDFDVFYGNVKTPLYDRIFDGEFDNDKILKININHQAIFYNRTVFEKIGMYNLKYKIAADYEFNLRCYFNKDIKVKYIDLVVAYFSEGGLSSVGFDELFYKEFPDIVKRVTGENLPLKDLRQYCSSYVQFVFAVIKRTLNIS
jgi:glycosyltransferase involved in cell wall biosynthesis